MMRLCKNKKSKCDKRDVKKTFTTYVNLTIDSTSHLGSLFILAKYCYLSASFIVFMYQLLCEFKKTKLNAVMSWNTAKQFSFMSKNKV